VDAVDVRAFEVRDHVRRDRAGEPRSRRLSRRLADDPFARGADEDRTAEFEKVPQPVQDPQIVFLALREADSRIDDQALRGDSCVRHSGEPLAEKILHFRDDVSIVRLVHHIDRRSAHMHDDAGGLGARGDFDHCGVAESGHVVDDRGAPVEGGLRHLGFVGVDRNRDVGPASQAFDHRQDATQLLRRRNGLGPGPGRLPADVQPVSPPPRQLGPMFQRRRRVEIAAAVRKTVGRNIHDSHHDRPFGPRPVRNSEPRREWNHVEHPVVDDTAPKADFAIT
jgi:hypothetical protein